MENTQDAYGVEDFCKRHGFSRAYIYLLWKRGEGPRFMQVGARRLISREAAADWRAQMENATKQRAAA
jgi:predicted DNA-binding transcriptional regulator AlpA